jgi:hypothetical protein
VLLLPVGQQNSCCLATDGQAAHWAVCPTQALTAVAAVALGPAFASVAGIAPKHTAAAQAVAAYHSHAWAHSSSSTAVQHRGSLQQGCCPWVTARQVARRVPRLWPNSNRQRLWPLRSSE